MNIRSVLDIISKYPNLDTGHSAKFSHYKCLDCKIKNLQGLDIALSNLVKYGSCEEPLSAPALELSNCTFETNPLIELETPATE